MWAGNLTNGKFDSAIHWSNQGPTPYQIYDNWLDFELSAPIGQAAAGDLGRFQDPAAQYALNEFAQTGDPPPRRQRSSSSRRSWTPRPRWPRC